MASVGRYVDVRKQDKPGGLYRRFSAVRAVGLAVEEGHKVARQKGLGALRAEHLARVRVGGAVQVWDSGRWRSVPQCSLELGAPEQAFAKALVLQQRAYLADLQLNVWSVDVGMQATAGSFDLIGDFSGAQNWGANGKVWVELKVLSEGGFAAKVREAKEKMVVTLDRERAEDADLSAALLLVAKVAQDGGAWSCSGLVGSLWVSGGDAWQEK